MSRPVSTLGLRHVALMVADLEASLVFYTDLVGMRIVWQPDADNVYLSSGTDNLALHRSPKGLVPANGRLDHIGFFLPEPGAVDAWYAFFKIKGVNITKPPKTHRDGARSFYCLDPDGTCVQILYVPEN